MRTAKVMVCYLPANFNACFCSHLPHNSIHNFQRTSPFFCSTGGEDKGEKFHSKFIYEKNSCSSMEYSHSKGLKGKIFLCAFLMD
jgi:hypothetical protein